MERAARLGVDIGRVIIDGSSHPSGNDTAFFGDDIDEVLRTPPMAGAMEILPGLVKRFGGRVWIHCRELQISDFVDDRLDVLEALTGVVSRRYLFGPQRQPAPGWVTPTPDWPAVAAAITQS